MILGVGWKQLEISPDGHFPEYDVIKVWGGQGFEKFLNQGFRLIIDWFPTKIFDLKLLQTRR